jgi:hypothetical protein
MTRKTRLTGLFSLRLHYNRRRPAMVPGFGLWVRGSFKAGDPEQVTGGGTWATFDSSGSTLGSGNFQVTKSNSIWHPALFRASPHSMRASRSSASPTTMGVKACSLWAVICLARLLQCPRGSARLRLRKLLEWFQRSGAFRCCNGRLNKPDNFRSQGEQPRWAGALK